MSLEKKKEISEILKKKEKKTKFWPSFDCPQRCSLCRALLATTWSNMWKRGLSRVMDAPLRQVTPNPNQDYFFVAFFSFLQVKDKYDANSTINLDIWIKGRKFSKNGKGHFHVRCTKWKETYNSTKKGDASKELWPRMNVKCSELAIGPRKLERKWSKTKWGDLGKKSGGGGFRAIEIWVSGLRKGIKDKTQKKR